MGFFRKESNKKQGRVRKTLIVTGALMFMMSFAPAVANNSFVDNVMGVETAYAASTAFCEYWQQDAQGGWQIKDGSGNLVRNAWVCDDIADTTKDTWYLIDANGNMISAGLVQDQTGNVYSLEMRHEGNYGKLRSVSGVYEDGVYLELESSHQGSFAKIKNQDGISALQSKYGLTQVSISNENCVYTSTFKAGSGTGAAGGPAGGQVQKPEVPENKGNGNGGYTIPDDAPGGYTPAPWLDENSVS